MCVCGGRGGEGVLQQSNIVIQMVVPCMFDLGKNKDLIT